MVLSTHKFVTRSTANLKPGITERDIKVEAKRTGKKRGQYNTNYVMRRQDDVEMITSIFKSTDKVGNEEFLTLVGGGRIQSKYKDEFLIVKAGKVPDEWVTGFVQSQLLSRTKIEQLTYATY